MLWNDIWKENSFSQHGTNFCHWQILLLISAKSLHCFSARLTERDLGLFQVPFKTASLAGLWNLRMDPWMLAWLELAFYFFLACYMPVSITNCKIVFSGHFELEFKCTLMWSIVRNNFKLTVKVVYLKENRI